MCSLVVGELRLEVKDDSGGGYEREDVRVAGFEVFGDVLVGGALAGLDLDCDGCTRLGCGGEIDSSSSCLVFDGCRVALLVEPVAYPIRPELVGDAASAAGLWWRNLVPAQEGVAILGEFEEERLAASAAGVDRDRLDEAAIDEFATEPVAFPGAQAEVFVALGRGRVVALRNGCEVVELLFGALG